MIEHIKDGVKLKVTFCYSNNKHFEDIKNSMAKCKVVGSKLYVLPNTPFHPCDIGVKVEGK